MNDDGTLQDDNGNKFRCCSRKPIGRGTFAEVFVGEWLNSPIGPPQKVAIKQFYLTKQTLKRALATEINIMQGLDHPNIVKLIAVVTDHTDDNERLWVVMELCEGGDFRNFLKDPANPDKQRRLSEKWARKYMQDILNGLRYLRSKQIIHRDLKPHNLLMTKNRQNIKISDFGFARILGSDALEATMCGTPLYMSPQVLSGERYDSKADLWSVGVILYEMLCGVRPFRDVNDIIALTHKVINEPIQFPKNVIVSRECRKMLTELLKKDDKQRIDWDNFFNHEWFTIQLDTTTTTLVPKSAPIAIPQQQRQQPQPQSKFQHNIITNYMDRVAISAPQLNTQNSITANRSFYNNNESAEYPTSVSVFATTPHGGSEPNTSTFGNFSSSDDDNVPSIKEKKGVGRSISNMFYTSVGLIKDSFQTGL